VTNGRAAPEPKVVKLKPRREPTEVDGEMDAGTLGLLRRKGYRFRGAGSFAVIFECTDPLVSRHPTIGEAMRRSTARAAPAAMPFTSSSA
jgi:hypothetical protein